MPPYRSPGTLVSHFESDGDMVRITSSIKSWAGGVAIARFQRRGGDLATLPFLPDVLLTPFKREGLDPVPQVRKMREAAPITRVSRLFGINIWMTTGYDATRAVLADTQSYSNDIRHLVGNKGNGSDQYIGGLGFTDPPMHTRLRRILTPEFTMRRLERLRPRIAKIVEQQLDAVEAAGPVADLVPLFAFPIPFLVICELLGLPVEDRESFRSLGHARFDVSQGGIGTFGAVSKSREFLLDAVAKQRVEPSDGLIGKIIAEHGDDISDLDLAGLADGVFTGGYETSASMIALGALALIQHPEHMAALRDGDAPVENLVEELLRYLSVVQLSFPRFAKHDIELFGSTVRAGDVVVCSLAGADRDPVLGGDVEGFDPLRAPTPHLAFGHGFHRCVGAELARMELRAAYPRLVRRFPNLRLAVPADELKFGKLSIVYGMDSLPVRID